MLLATKPSGYCPDCMKTEVVLKGKHLPFKETHIDAQKLLKAGYKSYPIVMPNDKLNDPANWSGFDYRKIMQYAQRQKK